MIVAVNHLASILSIVLQLDADLTIQFLDEEIQWFSRRLQDSSAAEALRARILYKSISRRSRAVQQFSVRTTNKNNVLELGILIHSRQLEARILDEF